MLIVEPVLMAPLTLAKSSDADGVATALGLQVDQKVDVEQMRNLIEFLIHISSLPSHLYRGLKSHECGCF